MVHPATSVLLFPAFTRHGEMDACCLKLTYHSEITRAFCSGGKGPPSLALKRLRDCQDGACGKQQRLILCVQWRADRHSDIVLCWRHLTAFGFLFPPSEVSVLIGAGNFY